MKKEVTYVCNKQLLHLSLVFSIERKVHLNCFLLLTWGLPTSIANSQIKNNMASTDPLKHCKNKTTKTYLLIFSLQVYFLQEYIHREIIRSISPFSTRKNINKTLKKTASHQEFIFKAFENCYLMPGSWVRETFWETWPFRIAMIHI